MKDREPFTTVGRLIEQLSVFDARMELDFSGLDFYRLKARGSHLIQVEFAQTVYRDKQGNVVVENHE